MLKASKIIMIGLVLCALCAGCALNGNPSVNKSSATTLENIYPKIPSRGIPSKISWSILFVRHDGRTYVINVEKEIDKADAGDKIGKVERYLDSTIYLPAEPFVDKDGDSNYAHKGALMYEYKGKDTEEEILVDDNGVLREALAHKKP